MTKTITESFTDYKGYTIRLRACTYNGFWYAITKKVPNIASPDGIKTLYLRKHGFNFISADNLRDKAANYIDNFSKQLEDEVIKLTSKLKQ